MPHSTVSHLAKTSLRLSCAAIALSLTTSLPAHAASLSYSGDTTSGPTFNRPEAPGFEGVNDPITTLSSIGTAVSYFSQPFSVDTTGSYDVVGTQNFDAVQFLYQTLFDPTSSLTNLISGNDPFPDTGNSGFRGLSLTSGNQYFLVTTGFANSGSSSNSFGTFTNTISGPGTIALQSEAVPEPSTVAGTLAIGLIGGGLFLKRKLRRQRSIDQLK